MFVSTGAFVSFVSVSDIGEMSPLFLSRSYAAIVVRGVDGAPFSGLGEGACLKNTNRRFWCPKQLLWLSYACFWLSLCRN